jgi:hypothetical protein
MRLLPALIVLLAAACGSTADLCTPHCASGQLCCSEPTHMFLPDGGGGSALVCVTPASDGTCPKQP